MKRVLSPLQDQILRHVAEFAGRFDCVEVIYVFGSVARGDWTAASDVDLAVKYRDGIDSSFALYESHNDLQCTFEDWRDESSKLFKMRFKFERIYRSDRDDETWFAVLKAAETPVGQIGKAIMAATPRHSPKPIESS